MSKISCDIIKDILPLYYDDVCSDDSKKMVEEHLDTCDGCKCELDRIGADIGISEETIKKNRSESNTIKGIANLWKRSKLQSFFKGVIIAVVLYTVIILVNRGLFHWYIVSVPTNAIEITNVCELKDGRIAYYTKLTDGYDDRNQIQRKFELKEDGNSYISIYRPLVKSKSKNDNKISNRLCLLDPNEENAYQKTFGSGVETKAIYFGTPEDNILVWEKGMNLPKASKEIEKMVDNGHHD